MKVGPEDFEKVIKGKTYMDHIAEVIPVEGFKDSVWDWNVYMERMFCPKEGFQVLCKECHTAKTRIETSLRKKHRDSKKS
jgi:hypothetical protein